MSPGAPKWLAVMLMAALTALAGAPGRARAADPVLPSAPLTAVAVVPPLPPAESLPEPPLPSALPPLAWALGTSVPLVLAGSLAWAQSGTSAGRNAGVGLITGGLFVGPLVGHLVAGERRRGLIIGSISLVLGGAMAAVLITAPDVVSEGTPANQLFTRQTGFYAALSANFIWGALGVLDLLGVPDRARKARRALRRLRPILSTLPGGMVVGLSYTPSLEP